MSLIANGAGEQPTGFYKGVATQSLRTTIADKSLKRTPTADGNKRTFTFSTWFKRSILDHVAPYTVHQILNAQVDGNDYFAIYFTDDFKLRVEGYTTSQQLILITNRLFRDVSAWYHLVVAVDTTQGTAANRVKIYVNGVQETSFATETYPAEDYDTYINNDDVRHTLACAYTDDSQRFEGYWADTNLIDGLQLAPTSFGEFKNGVWIPINTSGLTFGTNGFRLQFKQVGVGTASSSTIGADTSGNNNHYTSTNIVASDCAMPDSPENNFATLNPLYYLTASTHLSEGNLQLTHEATAHRANAGTMFSKTGKWYFEVRNKSDTASASVALGVGLQDITKNLVYSTGNYNYIYYCNNNSPLTALNTTNNGLGSFVAGAGDIMQVAYDADSGKLFIGKNNTYVAADSGTDGNPATGANPTATLSTAIDYIPFVGTYNNEATVNFGQDDTFAGAISSAGNTDGNGIGVFKYAPPSGFLALCSANLPEPTIGPNSDTQSDDHFNTVLYTGNGANSSATQDISGVGFKPDWLWIKRRDSAASHNLRDSTRGVLKHLQSDNGLAEDTESDAGVTAFLNDGFRLKGTNAGTGQVNANNGTFVAWNWKANGGTTSSNSNGSITSTVQANTTAGFSIVTYTGTGANATIGHGLSKALDVVLVKGRDNDDRFWNYYGTQFVNTSYIYLNVPAAEDTGGATITNSTYPTNSVFSVGTSTFVCGDSEKYVAYCFHEVEGYSKFGKYTGNGVADGPFAFTGFRPAWLMVKNIGASNHWWLSDSKRPGFNGVLNTSGNARVRPSLATVEDDAGRVDFLSNGFKIKTPDYAESNSNTVEYIYMAFAEAPFKYANAR